MYYNRDDFEKAKYYYERTLEIRMIWKKESIIIIELDAKHFQLMLLTLTTCLQSIMIDSGGNLGGAGGRPPPDPNRVFGYQFPVCKGLVIK
jgi:hypothetical protein